MTVRVSRAALQVLAEAPSSAAVRRVEVEAAVDDAGTAGTVRVQRAAAQVLAKAPPTPAVRRIEVEAAVDDTGVANAVRVRRVALQMLARASTKPPQPLSIVGKVAAWFLHNWVDGVSMESEFLTDVTRSKATLAEERRALRDRPARRLTVQWLHESSREVERILTHLRRMTRSRTVVPLYQDAIEVSATSTADGSATTIHCSTRYRRFFSGGRILVFPLDGTFFDESQVDVYLLNSVRGDAITTTTPIARTYAARQWLVVPVLDIELELSPVVAHLTDDIVRLEQQMAEVVGPSALPPTFFGGIPPGYQVAYDRPIFEPEMDWTGDVQTTFMRYGQVRNEGRRDVVVPEGDRYVQVQPYNVLADRRAFWSVLTLFEGNRGRAGSFWTVDREYAYTVTDVDEQFLDVLPLGTFADFRDDFTGHFGLVLDDGTILIRKVANIENRTTTWRITLDVGETLPDIPTSTIARFSRARLCRFQEDALTERWLTAETCRLRFSTVELVNEKVVDIG